ncbi:MAG TPA: M28 family peptidase [Gemmatimonadaceae bacterium]|nr:M28 family peptidase [Gemmatimonadaceae bacterium]
MTGAPAAATAHLAAIGRTPRAAGSADERAARDYCATVLRAAGFDVALEPFGYSGLPGRYGTPVGGAIAVLTILAAVWMGGALRAPVAAAGAFVTGVALLALWARRMLGDAVLDLPWLRAMGENLVATRGDRAPRVWLVAHLDSKSQPVPSAVRVAGVVLLVAGLAITAAAIALALAGAGSRTLWWIGAAVAIVGAVPVMASTVGNESPGALDDASGVAAVLAAAESLAPDANVGVMLPSAEELGLAGARAWARARRPERGVALNCDGVDDEGALTIMYSGTRPDDVIRTLAAGAERAPRVRRMPVGLMLDSVALTEHGWRSVTVSRGSIATLRRVHTRSDSLARLRGDGIPDVARVLARAAEALAR